MIRSLFRNTNLEELSTEVDEMLQEISDRLETEKKSKVPVGINFPKDFTQQSEKIAEGNVEWRKFFVDREEGIFSIHCRMDKSARIREHCHPNATEYIYVVNGGIINWRGDAFSGDVIAPMEEVKRLSDQVEINDNVKGWYEIPAGKLHHLQAMQDNTHFISKFIKKDNPDL